MQQWKEQGWGSGVLTPACSIVQPHPGAWVYAHSYHLAPKQQTLCQHPEEGDEKEKMHGHCDSHTGHLGKEGGRCGAQLWAQLTLISWSCLVFSSKEESGVGLCHLYHMCLPSLGSHQQVTGEETSKGFSCFPGPRVYRSLAGCLPCWSSPTHWS